MLIPLTTRHYLDESLHESSPSEAAVSAEDLSLVGPPWNTCKDSLTMILSRLGRTSFENSKIHRKKIDPGSTVWSDVCQSNGICMRQSGIFGSGGCCTGIASRLHKCWEAEEATVDDVDPKPPGSSKPLASSFSLSLARTNLSPSASGVCARHGMC